MNAIKVELSLPPDIAEACVAAVRPETKSEALTHSTLRIEKTEGGLSLTVEAQDLHALRAAANTYLRWVIMCAEITG